MQDSLRGGDDGATRTLAWSSVASLVLLAATHASGAIGCGAGCTEQSDAGLTVRVTDALTHEELCDALVTVTDGSYSERLLQVGGGCSYSGAWERPGTYRLTVTRSGYASATVDGVVVAEGSCHVVSVRRDVALTPE